MDVIALLDRLVAFASVVGTPNAAIAGWIADHLDALGASVRLLPGPEGDRSNLFATFGPADEPGYVLSGHMDVVPAGEEGWSADPFRLRREDDRLYARGACDMKGFLAAALAVAPDLARAGLARPIHFAFSYDEEAGCRGVPHLLARLPELCAPPLGAIIGEPSGMRPVRAHKGKAAARVALRGRAGHSSRPDQGLNAIHAMTGVLSAAVGQAERLRLGPFDANFAPPWSSLQVGTLSGGQSVNIIPEFCAAEIEARAIAGVDPQTLLDPVKQAALALEAEGFGVEWTTLSAYPALSLPEQAALATLLRDLSGQEPLAAVSYGTEAGLFQAAGVDAIICGPGDIARAHRPDEFIRVGELAACEAMLAALGALCRTSAPLPAGAGA